MAKTLQESHDQVIYCHTLFCASILGHKNGIDIIWKYQGNTIQCGIQYDVTCGYDFRYILKLTSINHMGQAQERFAIELEESETRYANLPVAVALKYDADFDAVATNLEAAAKFDAHVQEQVSSALGIPKTAGKKFSDLKLS